VLARLLGATEWRALDTNVLNFALAGRRRRAKAEHEYRGVYIVIQQHRAIVIEPYRRIDWIG
jgi:hypothetical protein